MTTSDSPSPNPLDADPDFSAEKIARLAKIHIAPEHLEQTQHQLGEILSFFHQLNELELDDVAPFFGAANQDHQRADEVNASSDRAQVLSNAPNSDGEFYFVPSVLNPNKK